MCFSPICLLQRSSHLEVSSLPSPLSSPSFCSSQLWAPGKDRRRTLPQEIYKQWLGNIPAQRGLRGGSTERVPTFGRNETFHTLLGEAQSPSTSTCSRSSSPPPPPPTPHHPSPSRSPWSLTPRDSEILCGRVCSSLLTGCRVPGVLASGVQGWGEPLGGNQEHFLLPIPICSQPHFFSLLLPNSS